MGVQIDIPLRRTQTFSERIDEVVCVLRREKSISNAKNEKRRFHQNQIKGEAMDAFVESLPTVKNKKMSVIYHTGEQNVMTVTQVNVAKAKGWTPCYSDGNSWLEYTGSKE